MLSDVHAFIVNRKDQGIAMGLFRSPGARIISGFNAGFHHYGMPKTKIDNFKDKVNEALATGGASAGLKAYAEW